MTVRCGASRGIQAHLKSHSTSTELAPRVNPHPTPTSGTALPSFAPPELVPIHREAAGPGSLTIFTRTPPRPTSHLGITSVSPLPSVGVIPPGGRGTRPWPSQAVDPGRNRLGESATASRTTASRGRIGVAFGPLWGHPFRRWA